MRTKGSISKFHFPISIIDEIIDLNIMNQTQQKKIRLAQLVIIFRICFEMESLGSWDDQTVTLSAVFLVFNLTFSITIYLKSFPNEIL